LAAGYMLTVQHYLTDTQQISFQPYESTTENRHTNDDIPLDAITIDLLFVQEALKTLPNLSILTTDTLKKQEIEVVNRTPTAVPARSLFDYQPNKRSGTHLMQPSMVMPLTELFEDAKSKNYPLYIASSYISLSDMSSPDELRAEPPAGYSFRHTGYMVSFGCGDVRDDQFETSICFSWLMRNNASIARSHGLLPLHWLGRASSSGYNTQDFIWLGAENLRDIKNVIE